MMCQCRFISGNKYTTLMGVVVNTRSYAWMGEGIYGKSLYFPLNLAVNLKLLSAKKVFIKNKVYRDFPGGAVVKNPPAGLPCWRSGWESACRCRGRGFEPWSGRIPHAVEQLVPWATITEPARLELVLHGGRGRDSERPAHRDEEWSPLAAAGEGPRTETKSQHSQK